LQSLAREVHEGDVNLSSDADWAVILPRALLLIISMLNISLYIRIFFSHTTFLMGKDTIANRFIFFSSKE